MFMNYRLIQLIRNGVFTRKADNLSWDEQDAGMCSLIVKFPEVRQVSGMTNRDSWKSIKNDNTQEGDRRYIVSSSHLVSEQAAELSEFEFGLIIAWNAFARWVTRCMAAAGMPDLSTLDILVLHSVYHRGRGKRLADICFVLNIEETHTVNYALKKLGRLGLVKRHRKGKDVLFEAAEEGEACIRKYREVRESCLVSTSASMGGVDHRDLEKLARNLRLLSGLYDQAARSATSL